MLLGNCDVGLFRNKWFSKWISPSFETPGLYKWKRHWLATLACLQLFLYIFSTCTGRRNSEEKGTLAAWSHQPPALHQAEQGDPSSHSIGNTPLAFWAQCWAPQWRHMDMLERVQKRHWKTWDSSLRWSRGWSTCLMGKGLRNWPSSAWIRGSFYWEGLIGSLPLPTWRLSNFTAEGQRIEDILTAYREKQSPPEDSQAQVAHRDCPVTMLGSIENWTG